MSSNVGMLSVPFCNMSIIVSKDEVTRFLIPSVASVEDVYCEILLFLIEPVILLTTVGKLSSPFSKISITVANDELTLCVSFTDAENDELN